METSDVSRFLAYRLQRREILELPELGVAEFVQGQSKVNTMGKFSETYSNEDKKLVKILLSSGLKDSKKV